MPFRPCVTVSRAPPSNLYAGLPAPNEGEEVVLWVQNAHPISIPVAGAGDFGRRDVHLVFVLVHRSHLHPLP